MLSTDLKKSGTTGVESPLWRTRQVGKRALVLEERRLKKESEWVCEGTETECHEVKHIEENRFQK